MSAPSSQIQEVLPKQGQVYDEDLPTMVLCKPKLLPLKSVTLEKLEKMQKDAEEEMRQQDLAASQQATDMFGHAVSAADKMTASGEIEEEPNRLVL
jgi:BBSome-interacting protein 1